MMRFRPAAMAALAFLAIGQACAADRPVPVAPNAQTFLLGSLKLVSLADARYVVSNDGKTFGVEAGPAAVAKLLARAGLPTDHVTLAVDALLVVEPGHVILLDTGLGPGAHGVLQASLAKAGYKPADVTDVLVTHTHGDHIGGLVTAAGGPAFPTAAIRMSATEWDWFRTKAGGGGVIKAVGPQVKTFEAGVPILPGISPIAISGHTPGHVGYEISSGGQKLLDIGDTAHSSLLSLAKPDWSNGFDEDGTQGKVSRRDTLTMLAGSHELVFAPHFPFPGVGRIEKAGDGFVWKPALK